MFGGYLQETKTLVSPHSGLKPPIPSEKYNFMQTFYLPGIISSISHKKE